MKIIRCISLFLFLIVSCRSQESANVKEEITKVRVVPVVNRELSLPVHSSGLLAPADEIKLSFKTGGIIEKIGVNEGQKVKKGTILAEIDLSEIKAAVNQARNGYEKAIRDLTRAENLYSDSVITLEMKQNAATAASVAKSSLEAAEFNLRYSTITAPADGMILKQLAREGELVSQGYPVFLFGTSGKYWKIKTFVSDRDIIRINAGDSASVSFDAYPSVRFTAYVSETGAMADPFTGTFETELLLEGGNVKLVPGFFASVEIYPVYKNSYSMVPVGSITEADGSSGYVYAVTDTGSVVKIRVNIIDMPGDMAAVTGIPENMDSVVSEGASYLKDGMKVSIVE